MSGRFSIVSRNGLLRADSDDGERLTLRIFPPHARNAAEWETCVHVNLSDLRQIVGHFEWLTEGETPETPETPETLAAEYERLTERRAKLFADDMLRMWRRERSLSDET